MQQTTPLFQSPDDPLGGPTSVSTWRRRRSRLIASSTGLRCRIRSGLPTNRGRPTRGSDGQRGWWNPFARPHSTYELTPHTRWVPLWEQTRMPISTRRLIPQTRVVQRPLTILGFKDEGDSRVTRAELAQDEQLAQAAPDETGWHAGRSKQTPGRRHRTSRRRPASRRHHT